MLKMPDIFHFRPFFIIKCIFVRPRKLNLLFVGSFSLNNKHIILIIRLLLVDMDMYFLSYSLILYKKCWFQINFWNCYHGYGISFTCGFIIMGNAWNIFHIQENAFTSWWTERQSTCSNKQIPLLESY